MLVQIKLPEEDVRSNDDVIVTHNDDGIKKRREGAREQLQKRGKMV